MAVTTIEWTATPLPDGTLAPGYTFNGWWGCQRWSPGCGDSTGGGCYAEGQAKRYGHDIWGPPSTTPRRFFGDAHWGEPLKWDRKARELSEQFGMPIRLKVFGYSFADWAELHPDVVPHRARLFDTIRATPNLDWLLLTKRVENIELFLPPGYWPNVWLGTSAENQHYWNARVPILTQLAGRAPVLFVSVEPMIGPVDLGAGMDIWCGATAFGPACHPANGTDAAFCSEARAKAGFERVNGQLVQKLPYQHEPCREPIIDYVDWIIVGGESGPRHRPFDVQWARDCRDICRLAGKAFFFKQHGGRTHATGGCDLDGVEVKEFPTPRMPRAA